MKVDIHLTSWMRPKITELTIRTIARNTKSGNYRLVVFDHGSTDEQQQMLMGLHENGLIDELVLLGNNIGLEAARTYLLNNCTRSKYFICADNDCLPEPMDETDWTEKLLHLMEKYEDYAAISCRTQVMIGTGNIFEDESKDITDFPHPGGSLRIMQTSLVKEVNGWQRPMAGNPSDMYAPGRGTEERLVCGKLRDAGYKTGFATHIHTLHLFGLKDTDRWGYDPDWKPEKTGHSDISHPALEQGDDLQEVIKYAGEADVKRYYQE